VYRSRRLADIEPRDTGLMCSGRERSESSASGSTSGRPESPRRRPHSCRRSQRLCCRRGGRYGMARGDGAVPRPFAPGREEPTMPRSGRYAERVSQRTQRTF